MLKIWGRKNSANVQKVLWCCAELDIPFERVDVGGAFGRNHEPDYLAMNPNARVPTIKDGELICWESNTIIRYLAATRNGARLHPTDPVRRTEVERWMDWQLAQLTPKMTTLHFGYYRTPPEQRNQAALDAALTESSANWSILDRHLDGRRYLAGDDFSLADISIGPFVHRWHVYPVARPSLPHLKAWYERLAERPGFQAHVAGPVS
jgi:glutathione S-transferase